MWDWRNSQYVNHQPYIFINFIDDADSSTMQKYDNTERQYEMRNWVTVHYADKYSEEDYSGEVGGWEWKHCLVTRAILWGGIEGEIPGT